MSGRIVELPGDAADWIESTERAMEIVGDQLAMGRALDAKTIGVHIDTLAKVFSEIERLRELNANGDRALLRLAKDNEALRCSHNEQVREIARLQDENAEKVWPGED
jgi:hypothetical protein